MGVLEDILARSQWMPQGGGFSAPQPVVDEALAAEQAREAAAAKLALANRRRAPNPLTLAPDETAPAIQMALGNTPQGAGVPFSTEAGMLAPPVTVQPPPAPVDPSTTDIAGGLTAGTTAATPTDISARSRTSPSAPLQVAPAAAPEVPSAAAAPVADSPFALPSILDKLRTTLGDNSNTLLALGAGFAGAPNIGQGISRAAAAAIPARAADIKQSLTRQAQTYGTKALVDAGVPIQQAIAAAGDPDLKKALIKSYIEDRGQEIQMIKTKDPWGGETEVPYIKNKFPKDGEPVLKPAFKDAQGGAAPAPSTNSANGTAIYAPGINQSNFDHSAVGEDYIAQLSPGMRSDVKAYLEGRSLPAGKANQAQIIKQIAKKYGDDIGMPADDSAIGQRKEWSKSLANTTNGVGLSSKGFKQGLEHFVGLSDNLVKMNLSNGLGLEPVAGAVNAVKNLTTEQKMLVNKNDVFGQALAREMGNLFAKNGGGVHEAAETKKNISNSVASSKAAAGSLEAIDELMQGGLRTLEHRRDELFPNGNAPRGSEFLGPDQAKQLAHIRRNIAILKGEEAATAPAASPVIPKPGKYEYRSGALVPVQ